MSFFKFFYCCVERDEDSSDSGRNAHLHATTGNASNTLIILNKNTSQDENHPLLPPSTEDIATASANVSSPNSQDGEELPWVVLKEENLFTLDEKGNESDLIINSVEMVSNSSSKKADDQHHDKNAKGEVNSSHDINTLDNKRKDSERSDNDVNTYLSFGRPTSESIEEKEDIYIIGNITNQSQDMKTFGANESSILNETENHDEMIIENKNDENLDRTILNDHKEMDIEVTNNFSSVSNNTQTDEQRIQEILSSFKEGDVVEVFDEEWLDVEIKKIDKEAGQITFQPMKSVNDTSKRESLLKNPELNKNIRWPIFVRGETVMIQDENGSIIHAEVDLDELIEGHTNRRDIVMVRSNNAIVPYPRESIKKFTTKQDTRDIVQYYLGEGFRPPPRVDSSISSYGRAPPLDLQWHPHNKYTITVANKSGLGVTFGWTKSGSIVVYGFKDIQLAKDDGVKVETWGPIESCGLVGIGDELMELNGNIIVAGVTTHSDLSIFISLSPKIVRMTFRKPVLNSKSS